MANASLDRLLFNGVRLIERQVLNSFYLHHIKVVAMVAQILQKVIHYIVKLMGDGVHDSRALMVGRVGT